MFTNKLLPEPMLTYYQFELAAPWATYMLDSNHCKMSLKTLIKLTSSSTGIIFIKYLLAQSVQKWRDLHGILTYKEEKNITGTYHNGLWDQTSGYRKTKWRLTIKYHQTSNISHTLVSNGLVDHSDVVAASPVGAAPTTSSFSTLQLASTNGLGKDNWKMRRESFKFWDLVHVILENLH